MKNMTFRNSKIVYYGPHPCPNCGMDITRMGNEWGGNAFTYPNGPIYPNTEWHPHVCDPANVLAKMGDEAKEAVTRLVLNVVSVQSKTQGWMIVAEDKRITPETSFYGTEPDAWIAAKEAIEKSFREAA